MKRLLIFLVSFACLPLMVEQAQACTCVERETPVCAAYWRSDTVFVGHLTGITPVDKNSKAVIPTATLRFSVEERFRGVTTSQIEVTTMSGTTCDMKFTTGERYLIYASLDQESNQLLAGPCTRTTVVTNAQEDLNSLRAIVRGKAKGSIQGKLIRSGSETLKGIKIIVKSGEKVRVTSTDEDGRFTLSLPASGNYTVRMTVPFAAEAASYRDGVEIRHDRSGALTTIEYDVKLAKHQCDYRELVIFQSRPKALQ